MDYVPLNRVAKFINGRAFKPSEWEAKGLPIIRIQNLTGTSTEFNYYGSEFDERYRVRNGDILISWSASLGVYVWHGDEAILNQHIFRVETNGSVDKTYFYYAAQSVLDEMKSEVHGATMQHITKDRFEALRIPLPPLAEQQRIAAVLAKADRLRQMRRYALKLSDSYLQSVFLQMFGDPVTNPMGWETGKLVDVIISAKDGPHVSPKYAETGIPFLSTRNVRKGEINWDDLKYISAEDAQDQWRKVKPERGDILYTKGGTTGLAKVVDFDRDIAVWVHIAVLKLRENKVNPVWLENMLNSDYCYQQSQELTFGIVNRDLGLKRMPRIKIYIPPLAEQEKFTCVVHQFKRLQAQQREAGRQADHLFDTLLHRAFRGDF